MSVPPISGKEDENEIVFCRAQVCSDNVTPKIKPLLGSFVLICLGQLPAASPNFPRADRSRSVRKAEAEVEAAETVHSLSAFASPARTGRSAWLPMRIHIASADLLNLL